jgi:hypothetical protein
MGVTMKNAIFWDVTPCGFYKNRHFLFLRSALRLLVTANVVPILSIQFTLMTEAICSPKRRLLQQPHGMTPHNTAFFKKMRSSGNLTRIICFKLRQYFRNNSYSCVYWHRTIRLPLVSEPVYQSHTDDTILLTLVCPCNSIFFCNLRKTLDVLLKYVYFHWILLQLKKAEEN